MVAIYQPTTIVPLAHGSPALMAAACYGQLHAEDAARYARIGDLPNGDYSRIMSTVYRRSGSFAALRETLTILRQYCREAYGE